jgi:penicillin-binding protein 2
MNREIDPDEIFIDSETSSKFDADQFEGRLERPISKPMLIAVGIIFGLIILVFLGRLSILQIKDVSHYASLSENNSLKSTPIFAARGVIYDRNNVELAWNAPAAIATASTTAVNGADASTTLSTSTPQNYGDGDEDVPTREYADIPGIAHTVGYVQYPSKDSSGFYYQEDFTGIDGVEKYFDSQLQGTNGLRLIEVDAHNKIQSENTIQPPKEGDSVTLSIDSRVQSELYTSIEAVAKKIGYTGGAGIIMDVHTGEVIAETSYPEYDPEVMSSKDDSALIQSYLSNPDRPFLNRVSTGLYTPGSIVKPYMALAALNENIIAPTTIIQGVAYISIKDPYDPTKFSIFKDWQAQGPEDMYKAIQESSDVYFYEVGGGYQNQKGLGITNIDKYMAMFGFGSALPAGSFFSGPNGTVPSPAWKAANFDGEQWYLGDTYHSSIGQYGWQVTPAQVVRAVASLANGGTLINPTIIKGGQGTVFARVDLPQADFDVVRQGMRMGAQIGVADALNVPYTQIAAKSGTAELGATRQNVNSWITGFWPYGNPKYAFAVTMENGTVHETAGATAAMLQTLNWMDANTPEYFK